MNISRKPHADSILKNLEPDLQEEVWRFLSRPKQEGPNSYKAAAEWLKKEHGIAVSKQALSRFWRWYGATQVLRSARTVTQHMAGQWQAEFADAPPEQIAQVVQDAYLALALKTEDPKSAAKFLQTFAKLAELKLAQQKEARAAETWEKLKAAQQAAEQRTGNPDGGLSPEALEQIERHMKLL